MTLEKPDMHLTALLRFTLLASAVACSSAFAQTVIETPLYSEAETRPGSQYRKDVNDIYASLERDGADASRQRLAPIIAYCEALERPGQRILSFATTDEYEAFLAETGDGQPTEWIDMACPMAYDLQGYLYSGARQWPEALSWLDRAIRMAPYYPAARNERAYVLAHSGDLQRGLEEYRSTLQLTETHPAAAYVRPLALRGIGWVLVEMGDLDGAQASYEASLKIDAGNTVALNELEYIRTQREKKPAVEKGKD